MIPDILPTTRTRPEDAKKVRPQLECLQARIVPAITGGPWTTPSSSLAVVSDMHETNNGMQLTVTVKDIATTDVVVNLMAYTRDAANSTPPGDIKFQKLFSLDTETLHAGQTLTLTTNLPCGKLYQGDVVTGKLSSDVLAGNVLPTTGIVQSVFGAAPDCTTTPPCDNGNGSHGKGSNGKGSGGKGSHGKGSHPVCNGSHGKGSSGKGSGGKGSNGKGSGGKGSNGKGSHSVCDRNGSNGKGSGGKGSSGKGSGGKGSNGKGSSGKGSWSVCCRC